MNPQPTRILNRPPAPYASRAIAHGIVFVLRTTGLILQAAPSSTKRPNGLRRSFTAAVLIACVLLPGLTPAAATSEGSSPSAYPVWVLTPPFDSASSSGRATANAETGRFQFEGIAAGVGQVREGSEVGYGQFREHHQVPEPLETLHYQVRARIDNLERVRVATDYTEAGAWLKASATSTECGSCAGHSEKSFNWGKTKIEVAADGRDEFLLVFKVEGPAGQSIPAGTMDILIEFGASTRAGCCLGPGASYLNVAVTVLSITVQGVQPESTSHGVLLQSPYLGIVLGSNPNADHEAKANRSTGEVHVESGTIHPSFYWDEAGFVMMHQTSVPLDEIQYAINVHVTSDQLTGEGEHVATLAASARPSTSGWSSANSTVFGSRSSELTDARLRSEQGEYNVTLELTMRNPDGGQIPAGSITLQTSLHLRTGAGIAGTIHRSIDATFVSVEGRFKGNPSEPPQTGVELSPPSQAKTVPARDDATYAIDVTNTGNIRDTFALASTGSKNGWSHSLSHDAVTLDPGASATVILTTRAGTTGSLTVTVTAVSTLDAETTDTATARTSVSK